MSANDENAREEGEVSSPPLHRDHASRSPTRPAKRARHEGSDRVSGRERHVTPPRDGDDERRQSASARSRGDDQHNARGSGSRAVRADGAERAHSRGSRRDRRSRSRSRDRHRSSERRESSRRSRSRERGGARARSSRGSRSPGGRESAKRSSSRKRSRSRSRSRGRSNHDRSSSHRHSRSQSRSRSRHRSDRDRRSGRSAEGRSGRDRSRDEGRSRRRSSRERSRSRERRRSTTSRDRGEGRNGSGTNWREMMAAVSDDSEDEEAAEQRRIEERRRKRAEILARAKEKLQSTQQARESSGVLDSARISTPDAPMAESSFVSPGADGQGEPPSHAQRGMPANSSGATPSAANGANDKSPDPQRSSEGNASSTVVIKAAAEDPVLKAGGRFSASIDMFSDCPVKELDQPAESTAAAAAAAAAATAMAGGDAAAAAALADNWDDADGYYVLHVGELLDARYKVVSFMGKGVYSTVLMAQDTQNNDTPVAVKVMRSNETMYRAGLKEIEVLRVLADADPDGRRHCVRMLDHFEHHNHLCVVFEAMDMNLRQVLKRFGHKVGLSLPAVRSYAKQLCIALRHLERCKIMHADIKPDNILVNSTKTVVRLADFGTASSTSENDITPYLVSRFYRAPEIVLGLPYGTGIDMWSTACTLYEMFTGSILFPGRSNNDMLKCIMDLRGSIPNKLIRRAAFAENHFDENGLFMYHTEDPVTKKAIIKRIKYTKPVRDLGQLISTSASADVERSLIIQFRSFLEQALQYDPSKRLTASQALEHPFLQSQRA